MRSRFSLSGALEKQLALQTRSGLLSGFAEAFRFLCEPLFECCGVLDAMASLRHSAPPCAFVSAALSDTGHRIASVKFGKFPRNFSKSAPLTQIE
jgi:hypothetical protein